MNKNLFFAGLGLASSCISVNALMPEEKILESSLAGSWYEADPAKLKRQILRWVESAALPEKLPVEKTIALIAPHAGYAYSGPVAAHGLKALAGKKYDRIIILGPSHRVYMRNQICLPNAAGLRTPLGVAEIDREAVSKLALLDFVRRNDEIHYHEHSVQIQLPLLQCVLGSPFKVIPVITGQLDAETARKTAQTLSPFLSPSTLVVISSDFTHYGRDFDYVPFRDNIAENLRKLDLGAFERIRTGRADKFAAYIAETGATICGEGPIRILLEMLPRDHEISLLKYANSADENRDYSHCVSYVSGLVTGAWAPAEKAAADSELPESDRLALLKMARESIAYVFKNRKATPDDLFHENASEAVQKKMGCFVTLKIGEDLRGCIGEIEPMRPLYQAVTGRAVDSAFRDPRFPQLTPEEFRRVEIEISALTPSRPVNSWQEIEIGRHGMTITKDGRSAVFLPQVAPEQGWNLEQTLTYLSRKAGLPADAWRSPDARFTVFEAIVFKESDFRKTGK